MALSKTLQQFLDRMQVEYEVFLHAPTPSASRTAEASHISADKIAKGVLLKDESGYVLAVLPASHHLDLQEIERVLDSPASLAGELELAEIFRDCALGAVPAVGAAYGLDVIADERVMALGDRVLFYHSSCDPPAVAGTAVVARTAYPYPTAWDKRDDHYDPKASPENPIWQMVDIRLERIFKQPVAIGVLRATKALGGMELLRTGSRLSVQPVKPAEFAKVLKLAKA